MLKGGAAPEQFAMALAAAAVAYYLWGVSAERILRWRWPYRADRRRHSLQLLPLRALSWVAAVAGGGMVVLQTPASVR